MQIREHAHGVEFWVHVRPRASRDEVGGTHGDALAVRVRAAPTDGRANTAVCAALAHALALRPREVELRAGASARRKRVLAHGPPDALRRALERLAGLTSPGSVA